MSAYIVVQITIHDPVSYELYKTLAAASLAVYGGRYIVRGGTSAVLEGSWQPARLVVLEFPTSDQARAWWSSPEYAPAKAVRQRSAHTEMLLIEGAQVPSANQAPA
ncbi:MAG TPA: DUF1330 domain-containing protein [Gemmatimonadales bacterium]|nr:DUF1330 domain-containing protein [Gemmatimonadales bacterium]